MRSVICICDGLLQRSLCNYFSYILVVSFITTDNTISTSFKKEERNVVRRKGFHYLSKLLYSHFSLPLNAFNCWQRIGNQPAEWLSAGWGASGDLKVTGVAEYSLTGLPSVISTDTCNPLLFSQNLQLFKTPPLFIIWNETEQQLKSKRPSRKHKKIYPSDIYNNEKVKYVLKMR